MYLNKKTLFTTCTAIVLTGCVNTTDKTAIEKEKNVENATSLAEQTQSELNLATEALKLSDEKVAVLTAALAKSETALKAKTEMASKKITKKTITHTDNKTILGQSEWVYVSKLKDNFKGRIDTGAATSSINAVDIENFERDGKKWVRFNLAHAKDDKAEMIEARVIRIAKIKQSSNPDENAERPVVELHVRIGDVAHQTEFTLTNRQHMEYPVLIGRTFMQDVALVDVSKEYIFPKYQAPSKN